jgi:hypothetical protein
MIKISLAPVKISCYYAIGQAEYQYEARLWNVLIVAAFVGFMAGMFVGCGL